MREVSSNTRRLQRVAALDNGVGQEMHQAQAFFYEADNSGNGEALSASLAAQEVALNI